MYIAFTICSNNYLAKAKVCGDSFIRHHPDYRFIIILVDTENEGINYDFFNPYEIVSVSTIYPGIADLALVYNIIELSTAVKAAAFTYLFKVYKSRSIFYLDPDLSIFDRFAEVEEQLDQYNYNLVVTPHFLSPIDDGKYPSELDFAVYGLYNLGFIAIKNTSESLRFLDWWHERLMKYCFIRPEKGMFTDQIWVNYAPVFFEGVCILKNPGYNVANWNLYERNITKVDDRFYINDRCTLKFFHFSHFVFDHPYSISKSQTRHTIDEIPVMKQLVDDYKQLLVANNHTFYNTIISHFQQLYSGHQKEQHRISHLAQNTFKRKVKHKLSSYLTTLLGD
jgi:hypothetical protein